MAGQDQRRDVSDGRDRSAPGRKGDRALTARRKAVRPEGRALRRRAPDAQGMPGHVGRRRSRGPDHRAASPPIRGEGLTDWLAGAAPDIGQRAAALAARV